MATVVVDYAWGRPGVAALRSYGAVAVCRYLSYPSVYLGQSSNNGKNLTKAEADTLRAGGIDIVANWEYYGDWDHDYSGGFDRGVQHARDALTEYKACGGPMNGTKPARPIYFSTDFNPTTDQLTQVDAYYKGVASVISLAMTGAYGGWKTISTLFNLGLITWGWQTYAWSQFKDPDGVYYTRWDQRAQLRQVKNGITINGVDCDRDEAQTADFGQWGGVSDVNLTDPVTMVVADDVKFDNPTRTVETTLASTLYYTLQARNRMADNFTAVKATLAAILAASRDDADTAQILARIDEVANEERQRDAAQDAAIADVDEQVVARLGSAGLSAQEVADLLRPILGEKATQVGTLLAQA